uniref:Putative plant transposon protein domain-containing protein n=1 Tax=Nicotiana tabacum TaxID=4097 RepID=A0A1S3XLX6_TOBAC|nr:PREDICTED: uncharacterized protein LOC107766407 [Nicotiana tabacum]
MSKPRHLRVQLGNQLRDMIPPPQKRPMALIGIKPLVLNKSSRSRKAPPQGSISKRHITRLQKKEEFESLLRKRKEGKKKKRLVKDGMFVNEWVVPPALVVDIDDEVDEEPGSLVCETSGGKVVEELGDKETEELVERVSKKRVSETSAEKRKSARKLVKRKADATEEPSSSKKTKVGASQDAGREKLRIQKVLWGRTFAPDILDMSGMCQLVEIYELQQWIHLFTSENPRVYEAEVCNFYIDFFTVEDDSICLEVNGVNFVMDTTVLGAILGVSTDGMSSIDGVCSTNFRNTIVKDKAVQQGEWVHKKALLPVYQLLFEIVNNVLLPCAKRCSITSRAYLVLMEALHGYTTLNLSGLMIEHMKKIAEFNKGNHGLPYGFLLTKVFEFFKVPLGQAKVGTRNVTEEIRKLKARNSILENQLNQAHEEAGSSGSQNTKVARADKGKCCFQEIG